MVVSLKLLIVSFNEINTVLPLLIKKLRSYLNIKIIQRKIPDLKFFLNRGNQRYAIDYLKRLEDYKKENNCDFVLGITKHDLFIKKYNFIFGIANQTKKVAILSYQRLQSKDRNIFHIRLLKESIHELGHLFGLDHCNKSNCVMFYSNSIIDTDKKEHIYCASCSKLIIEKYGREITF